MHMDWNMCVHLLKMRIIYKKKAVFHGDRLRANLIKHAKNGITAKRLLVSSQLEWDGT